MIEHVPKYTLTEEFANTVKTDTIETTDMSEAFSFTMDFLQHCGFTKEMIDECYEAWKDGFI